MIAHLYVSWEQILVTFEENSPLSITEDSMYVFPDEQDPS